MTNKGEYFVFLDNNFDRSGINGPFSRIEAVNFIEEAIEANDLCLRSLADSVRVIRGTSLNISFDLTVEF